MATDPERSWHPVRPKLAGLFALALLAAACGDDSDDATSTSGDSDGDEAAAPEGDRLNVVTTVAPLTNIVANVGGDRVEGVGLIPDGADSHTYEAPASAAEILAGGDVLFYNGLDLEISIEQMAEATMEGEAQMVALGEETITPEEYIYDFSFPEDAGSPNPHLWTSPPLGKEYAEVLRDTLSE
jgi:ABC-type Zn uptake system ZnuABC Zn-binding protein ZnuA